MNEELKRKQEELSKTSSNLMKAGFYMFLLAFIIYLFFMTPQQKQKLREEFEFINIGKSKELIADFKIIKVSYDAENEVLGIGLYNNGTADALDVNYEIRGKGRSDYGTVKKGQSLIVAWYQYINTKKLPRQDSIALWWSYIDKNGETIFCEPREIFFTITKEDIG